MASSPSSPTTSSSEELYTKGARIWIPDAERVWRGAVLLRDFKTGDKEMKIKAEDGEELTLTLPRKSSAGVNCGVDLPPLRNPDILIGENDLTAMSYLHEPAVLHNLTVRFMNQNTIYTYCGIVLVAINPYHDLPIYDADTIQAYMGQDMGSLDPHIFAVAEEAYKDMSRFDRNQSIIVSGESGAGKTVSAKYAMRYFASVGGSQTETQIEKKVLASNPIMEAIGNAKTTRNDNSSRFGKYIEISFNQRNLIVGSSMRTYLLEKSRVVYQAKNERNYHIFYQLCASCDLPELQSLKLAHSSQFQYTNQGRNAVIPGVDDFTDLEATRQAFGLLGIADSEQMNIFRVLAAILHLGNVEIAGQDQAEVYSEDQSLLVFCELMGVDLDTMSLWLINRKINTVNDTMIKPLSGKEAKNSRDALAKHIYSCLFNWIVNALNKALAGETKSDKFIGVLDIYGFETFETNSFEQFCINYANEKLQQQFNLHVFKLEQEEYVAEGISWSMIDFYDNQPCIDLIESKLGILDLLDEECRMPSGSDKQWCLKLYYKHDRKKKHFSKPRMSNVNFVIHHFADKVDYLALGFLEKNRDAVQEEQLNVLKAADFGLIAELLLQQDQLMTPATNIRGLAGCGSSSSVYASSNPSTPKLLKSRSGLAVPRTPGGIAVGNVAASPMKGTRLQKKTVGSQFRDSLNELMATLTSTEPHYVRCIKPNDDKAAFDFDDKRAVQQLRACGVLETVRISAAGYPSRWTYGDFFSRYRVLINSKLIDREDMRKTCDVVLLQLTEKSGGIVNADKYQFGKTKIFFRAGQVAYLEKLRSSRLRACGVMIQKHVRAWIAHKRYQRVRKSVMLAQRFGRGFLARKLARRLKEDKAATKLQAAARGFLQRRRYQKIRRAVLRIQFYTRRMIQRRKNQEQAKERAVIVMQKYARRFIEQRRYHRIRDGLIAIQAHARRKRAAKELKRLRNEAKSMDHLKKLNQGLENKIIELQQKLTEQYKLQLTHKEKEARIKELEEKLGGLKASKAESIMWSNKFAALEAQMQKLKTENENLTAEKADLSYEKDMALSDAKETEEKLKDLTQEAEKEKEKFALELDRFKNDAEEDQKEALEQAKKEWERAHEDELVRYQKLLGEYNRLEQRYENVHEELQDARNNSFAIAEARPTQQQTFSATEDGLQNQDAGDVESEDASAKMASQAIRLQEIEQENAKLQNRLDRYQKAIANSKEFEKCVGASTTGPSGVTDGDNNNNNDEEEVNNNVVNSKEASQVMLREFESMKAELVRRRDECVELKTMVATLSMAQSKSRKTDRVADASTDGELESAYRAEKETNKVLNEQILKKDKTIKEMTNKTEKMKLDAEEKQKLLTELLASSSGKQPESTEAMLQRQNQMLTIENLDLKEKMDEMSTQCDKLKKALKSMAKRQGNGGMGVGGGEDVTDDAVASLRDDKCGGAAKTRSPHGAGVMANILRREPKFKGMLSYAKDVEPQVIKNLILELQPKCAATLLPGLPSYLIFMCIRHMDYTNDDAKLKSFLSSTVNGIKRVVKRFNDDADRITLWLANTCRLLHNLKQYSGEKSLQKENNDQQNEQSLRNFDLSEYRQVLSDLAVWIYQGLVRILEEKIQRYIITAVLENEAITGLSQTKPVGMRNRISSNETNLNSSKNSNCTSSSSPSQSLDALTRCLNQFLKMMHVHGVDKEIVNQMFKQLFYYIGASALNNLLLRKEMCHWARGMQIRFNVSHLEQWIHENKLETSEAVATLQPIVQASQLLQARKEIEDVTAVCDICSKLSAQQVVKILNLYTPNNEFEGRVSIVFIRQVQERLRARDQQQQQLTNAVASSSLDSIENQLKNALLMDTRFTYPVRFPFCSSNVALEEITVPEVFNLPFLKRV